MRGGARRGLPLIAPQTHGDHAGREAEGWEEVPPMRKPCPLLALRRRRLAPAPARAAPQWARCRRLRRGRALCGSARAGVWGQT